MTEEIRNVYNKIRIDKYEQNKISLYRRRYIRFKNREE